MNAVLQFFARIQNRLLIAMLTVTAIPLIAVIVQANRQTTDALVSQAHESLEYQALFRSLGLLRLFEYSAGTVTRMTKEADFRSLVDHSAMDETRAFGLFENAVESSQLSRLAYFEYSGQDAEGMFELSMRLSYPPILERSDGLRRLAKDRFLEPAGIGFSDDAICIIVIPISVLVPPDTVRRVGVLTGTVSSETIRRYMASEGGDFEAQASTGYFLTQRLRSSPGATLLQPGPEGTGVTLAHGRALSEIVGQGAADRILAERRGLMTLDFRTIAWESFEQREFGVHLVVGVVQDQDTLLQPVAEARRIFLFILAAALLLSILLCVVFARQLTKPIDELRQGARELAAGHLDRRIHVETGDEIELLAADFNSMAEALEQSQHHLEQRIEEKTEELQRANRVLMQTEKLRSLGEVAAGVAHEINNPAGIVSMYAEMLLEKPDLEERDRKKLQLILENAERISGIAGGMLDFSRTHEFSADPVSVLAPLEKALSLVSIQKIASDVDIVRDLPEVLPPVRGDENQLIQVFLNLMTNALQAMPKGGRLTVSARALEDRVEVRVSDTGTGIDPDNLEKLFEPFFTTKAPGEGTGLGLSISYGIIRNHSGELSVESTGEHGTTFLVCLPRHDRDASTQGQEEER